MLFGTSFVYYGSFGVQENDVDMNVWCTVDAALSRFLVLRASPIALAESSTN